MTLQDLMDRAILITNLTIGNEALFYYNEVIDYLLAKYPDKITSSQKEIVDIGGDNKFTVPSHWAFVLKVTDKEDRRVYCDTVDDTMIFPYSGEFTITYTKKPAFMKSLLEPLEHNRIFDMCIPYYFAWKMSERDRLSANQVQKFQGLFYEYLNAAIKKKSKFGLKRIKVPRFR